MADGAGGSPSELAAKMRPANAILDGISVRILDFGTQAKDPTHWNADLKAISQLLNRLIPIMRTVGLSGCT